MTTMTDPLEERVRKLLALADDQWGTPEGRACEEKAYTLIAKYGLDARRLSAANTRGADGAKHGGWIPPEGTTVEPSSSDPTVWVARWELTGPYQREHRDLVGALGQCVRCVTVCRRAQERTRIRQWLTVYGAEADVRRLRLLAAMLVTHMLAGARRQQAETGAETTRRRRSYMFGFIRGVVERLEAAERRVEDVEDRTAGGRRGTAALARQTDLARAQSAVDRDFRRLGSVRPTRSVLDPRAQHAGYSAGSRSDLGQTRVGMTRRALGR